PDRPRVDDRFVRGAGRSPVAPGCGYRGANTAGRWRVADWSRPRVAPRARRNTVALRADNTDGDRPFGRGRCTRGGVVRRWAPGRGARATIAFEIAQVRDLDQC